MVYPVVFQVLSDVEEWQDACHCHALQVNGLSGSSYWEARAQQAQATAEFRFRYSRRLAELIPQRCRILFGGRVYQVEHIDDYKFQHHQLTFKAVCGYE